MDYFLINFLNTCRLYIFSIHLIMTVGAYRKYWSDDFVHVQLNDFLDIPTILHWMFT